jgi:hypothetical protein
MSPVRAAIKDVSRAVAGLKKLYRPVNGQVE